MAMEMRIKFGLLFKDISNGATKRYVEYFTPFEFNKDLTAFHYLDSGLNYSGGETSTELIWFNSFRGRSSRYNYRGIRTKF